MSKPNDGDAAFPRPAGENARFVNDAERGMSLRDYFAAQAITGILDDGLIQQTNPHADRFALMGRAAVMAYAMADALIAEREKAGAT